MISSVQSVQHNANIKNPVWAGAAFVTSSLFSQSVRFRPYYTVQFKREVVILQLIGVLRTILHLYIESWLLLQQMDSMCNVQQIVTLAVKADITEAEKMSVTGLAGFFCETFLQK